MNGHQRIACGLALISAGALSACSPPPPAAPKIDQGAVVSAVKADVHQLIADFNAHDAAKAVSHDAPGIVAMFHGLPNSVGLEADLAATQKQVADLSSFVAVSNETVDVAASGDLAIYRATYAYTSSNPVTKKAGTEYGNWVIAYRPQPGGGWKIIWDVVSDTSPVSSAIK